MKKHCWIILTADLGYIESMRQDRDFVLRAQILLVFERIWGDGGMSLPECPYMIFEGTLVLEIWATAAIPELPTVLLMGAPVAPDSKGFVALAAHERLDSVLAFVMCLKSAEVLQRFGPGMIYIISAPLRTAVAWKSQQYCCRLRASQWFWPFPVLRSMSPHMHLHVVIAIEGLSTDWAGELSSPNENLWRCRYPILAFWKSCSAFWSGLHYTLLICVAGISTLQGQLGLLR